jgi:hypothetical protein
MLVNPYRSTPYLGRSSLLLAIVLLALALVLATIVVEPLLTLKARSFQEAEDYQGYDGTLCGHVASVRNDPIHVGTLLLFDDPYTPSFEVLISTPTRSLQTNYDKKEVCVAGRIMNEGEGPQDVPSIRVTDELQVSIK